MNEATTKPLPVVFDTQIFLRALINPNSACGRLFSTWRAEYTLFIAPGIRSEIHDVLTRAKVRKKFPHITDGQTTAFLRLIDTIAVNVALSPDDIEPICRDPKDDVFLACAKVAKASYLVSEDNDLLVLHQHHTVQIVKVGLFLTILESRQQAE